MANVWTVPRDVTRLLLTDSNIREYLADGGKSAPADPTKRWEEVADVLGALQQNLGRTFTTVGDAASALFVRSGDEPVGITDGLKLIVMRLITAQGAERKPVPKPLSPQVKEALGTYVFALVDPRDSSVFYAGKGRGDQIFAAVWEALAGQSAGAAGKVDPVLYKAALQRIRDIDQSGGRTEHFVVRHAITPAVDVEHAASALVEVIDDVLHLSARDRRTPLHSATRVEELALRYSAEPAPELPSPCVVVEVEGASAPGLTRAAVYELSRTGWAAGPAARNAKDIPVIVFAGNVIRAVFRAQGWERDSKPGTSELWRFVGAADADMEPKFVGRRITPDRLGLERWPANGWVLRQTQARPGART